MAPTFELTRAYIHTLSASRRWVPGLSHPTRRWLNIVRVEGSDRTRRQPKQIPDQPRADQLPNKRNSTKQDFYDYYFAFPMFQKAKRGPSAQVIANAALEAVPEDLRNDPTQCFSRSDTSIDLAGKCLEAFTSHQDLMRTKSESRAVFRKIQPGARALDWIQDFGHDTTFDFAVNFRFMDHLAHCLVAEGNSDLV